MGKFQAFLIPSWSREEMAGKCMGGHAEVTEHWYVLIKLEEALGSTLEPPTS